jgi:uncharacterized protein
MTDDLLTNHLQEGLTLFSEGHWFEAHEVLETAWRAQPKGVDREALQGLIQLAVSLEHNRRGNPRGAAGQWQKAQGHLADVPDQWRGVDIGGLRAQFRSFYDPHTPGPLPMPVWSRA